MYVVEVVKVNWFLLCAFIQLGLVVVTTAAEGFRKEAEEAKQQARWVNA